MIKKRVVHWHLIAVLFVIVFGFFLLHALKNASPTGLSVVEYDLLDFSTQDANSTNCGNVTSSIALAADLHANATCFFIRNSSITIDGAGYAIIADNNSLPSDEPAIEFNTGLNHILIKNLIFRNYTTSVSFNSPNSSTNITLDNITSNTHSNFYSTNLINLTLSRSRITGAVNANNCLVSHRVNSISYLFNSTYVSILNNTFNLSLEADTSSRGPHICLGRVERSLIQGNTFILGTSVPQNRASIEISYNSSNITIENNTFVNIERSISTTNSTNIFIQNNTFNLSTNTSRTTYAVLFQNNSFSNLSYNTFNARGRTGIIIINVSNNTFFIGNVINSSGASTTSETFTYNMSFSPLTIDGRNCNNSLTRINSTSFYNLNLSGSPNINVNNTNKQVNNTFATGSASIDVACVDYTNGGGNDNATFYVINSAPLTNCTDITALGVAVCYGFVRSIYVANGVGVTYTYNTTALANVTNATSASITSGYDTSPYLNISSSLNQTTTTFGVRLLDSCGITFYNNALDNTTLEYSSASDLSCSSQNFTVNNSYGQIVWENIANLTLNGEALVGRTIFLENNNVGLLDTPLLSVLNRSARIEIRNLTYTTTPFLMKDGVRCDNTNDCNVSYNSTLGIFYANVSSFSNYSVQEPSSVGRLNQSTTLNQNVSANETGFTITSSNLILDCRGYKITFSNNGNAGDGINSTAGYDNVTIKNCIIEELSSNSASQRGIDLRNTQNSTFTNNTIIIRSSGTHAISLFNSSGNNISSLTILIYNTSSVGINLEENSSSNNITGNVINVRNGSAYAIQLLTRSNNNMIQSNYLNSSFGVYIDNSSNSTFLDNNITITSTTGNAFYLLETSSGNVFFNTNITGNINFSIADETNSNSINSLVYNNTFGMINWTKNNITTNLSLSTNTTIFIQSNLTGIIDSVHSLRLNGSAKIRITGLSHSSTVYLLKNGVRCDNTNDCNISYNSTTGILNANVSSFSNYTVSSTDPTPVSSSSSSSSSSSATSSSGSSGGGSCPEGSALVNGHCETQSRQEETPSESPSAEATGSEQGVVSGDAASSEQQEAGELPLTGQAFLGNIFGKEDYSLYWIGGISLLLVVLVGVGVYRYVRQKLQVPSTIYQSPPDQSQETVVDEFAVYPEKRPLILAAPRRYSQSVRIILLALGVILVAAILTITFLLRSSIFEFFRDLGFWTIPFIVGIMFIIFFVVVIIYTLYRKRISE